MRKASLFICFCLLFLGMVASPLTAFASNIGTYGAGEWDYLGSTSYFADGYFERSWGGNWQQDFSSKSFSSGGGNVKYCISGFNANSKNTRVSIMAYEYDKPADSFAFYSNYEKIGANGVICEQFGVSNIAYPAGTDGSNDKAEIKFEVQGGRGVSGWNDEWVKIKVWD